MWSNYSIPVNKEITNKPEGLILILVLLDEKG
jgi:hypothetical protein